jgi:hypothetical protein
MSGSLQLLKGPGGLSAGPFTASLGTTLAPGDTEPVTITLDKQVPAGPWDAEITLKSGLLTRSARATISFPRTVGLAAAAKATPTHRKSWFASGELSMVVVIVPALLIAALVALGRRAARRRRRTLTARHRPAVALVG